MMNLAGAHFKPVAGSSIFRIAHREFGWTKMQDIYQELSWRGLIYQSTDEENLPQWLKQTARTVYAGFDPTAESLHVGSLLPLLMLRRFQRAGHRVIAVIGGATGMIGDPSGKSAERNLLNEEQLRQNLAGIEQQARQFLDLDGDNAALILNNYEWIKQFSYVEFLRDVGKNCPVNVMLAKDSIKGRLDGESGISYTEFSYMLLQAYDFVHLFRKHHCELQIGGSDQWGNITAGIDLARRMCGVQLYGITNPLLTRADGAKMGKTEQGAVWISAERTSPYQFYQYWINTADEDVGNCLRFLTDLTEDEILELDRSREKDAGKKASQRRLAEEMTRLVHGETGVAAAKQASEKLFERELENLSDQELNQIFADVPSCELSRSLLDGDGLPLVEAMHKAQLAKSKGEARRTIVQGGAYVNNRRRQSVDDVLTASDLASETTIVLRSGRKKYALLRFVD